MSQILRLKIKPQFQTASCSLYVLATTKQNGAVVHIVPDRTLFRCYRCFGQTSYGIWLSARSVLKYWPPPRRVWITSRRAIKGVVLLFVILPQQLMLFIKEWRVIIHFYPFTVTFNVVEAPQNTAVTGTLPCGGNVLECDRADSI